MIRRVSFSARKRMRAVSTWVLVLWAGLALAATPARTPTGALQAGNADGSIPAWTGGLTQAPAGFRPGGFHVDPFANDVPLQIIDSAAAAHLGDALTAGQQALFARYPDTFRMHIYPSRRTHAMPEWLYESTARNHQEARLSADGNGLAHVLPGIPFPQPRNGLEAVWNHLLRWRGTFIDRVEVEGNVYENGTRNLYRSKQEIGFATYRRTTGELPGRADILLYYSSFMIEPAHLAGGGFLLVDTLDQSRQPRLAWNYDPAERRVRRVPYAELDSPAVLSDNLRTVDDTDLFSGTPAYYEWTLDGLEEHWIPYNNYRLPLASQDALLTPFHLNPAYVRWEKHRVWKVTGRLREGRQHSVPLRIFYIDEDSWAIVISESYNARGELIRVGLAHPANFYDVPMTLTVADVFHDLRSRRYNVKALLNGEPSPGRYDGPMPPDSHFQPAQLRQRAVR